MRRVEVIRVQVDSEQWLIDIVYHLLPLFHPDIFRDPYLTL